MSMPSIPNNIDISRETAISLLIVSIAMEELAMSHILNAEGEKIQYILGTLEENRPEEVTICDIMEVNKSVNRTLRNIIKNQMLMQFKLEDAMEMDFPSTTETES